MPNLDNPRGATLASDLRQARWLPKATNAAIYPGDFVRQLDSGLVAVATAGSIELVGVCLGYQAATATEVLVAVDPDQDYYLQDDGVGGTLAATNVGQNLDLLATAGNATYLKSQHEADTNTVTIAAAQLRILDKHPDDSWADNVRLRVVINEHAWSKKTAGI